MDFATCCIHGARGAADTTGTVSVPIYQTATFSHLGVGLSTGHDYSRVQNSTREHFEKTLACLESGTDALAFASGAEAVDIKIDGKYNTKA